MDDKKGLQTLINETIKALKIVRPLLIPIVITAFIALPQLFAMIGK
jgi:hypothetical protein